MMTWWKITPEEAALSIESRGNRLSGINLYSYMEELSRQRPRAEGSFD